MPHALRITHVAIITFDQSPMPQAAAGARFRNIHPAFGETKASTPRILKPYYASRRVFAKHKLGSPVARMPGRRRQLAGLHGLPSKPGMQFADILDGDGDGVDRILHHADADRCTAARPATASCCARYC